MPAGNDAPRYEPEAASGAGRLAQANSRSGGRSGDGLGGRDVAGETAGNAQNTAIEASGKTSGKSRGSKGDLPLVAMTSSNNLPLTAETDIDIELGAEVSNASKGWRLEENSDGYYRWRWQIKDDNGKPVTYVNKSGKVVYKRGCEYVPRNKVKDAKEEVKQFRKSK